MMRCNPLSATSMLVQLVSVFPAPSPVPATLLYSAIIVPTVGPICLHCHASLDTYVFMHVFYHIFAVKSAL